MSIEHRAIHALAMNAQPTSGHHASPPAEALTHQGSLSAIVSAAHVASGRPHRAQPFSLKCPVQNYSQKLIVTPVQTSFKPHLLSE